MIVRGSILPDNYRQLEYIQSSGTQWIDTEINMKSSLRFDITLLPTVQGTDERFLGSYGNGIYIGQLQSKWRYGNSCTYNDIAIDYVNPTRITAAGTNWTFNEITKTVGALGSNNLKIVIFGAIYQTNPDTPYGYGSCKLYSCKIWDGDTQLRYFVPCERISDSTLGLYDIINSKFYTNAGSGTFIKGSYKNSVNTYKVNYLKDTTNPVVFLPAAYQQVEYIQSTGTQRIKTNIQPTSKYKIEEEFAITDRSVTSCIWCARGSSTGAYTTTAFNIANSQVRCDYGVNASMNNIGAINANQRYKLTMDSEKWYLDGTLKTTMSSATFTSGSKIQLMASHYNGIDNNLGNYARLKLYRFSVWDTDRELIGNFIPCYRKSDSVIGLYDTVGDSFYTNDGTGTFLKGNNINSPLVNCVASIPQYDYQQVEYIQSSGSQYVNTNYYWQSEITKIEADIIVTSNSGNQSLWGNEEYINTTSSTRYFSGIPHGKNGSFSYYIGTSGYGGLSIGMNTRVTVIATTDASKKVLVTANNTTKVNTTYNITCQTHTAEFTSDSKGLIYIFANHNSGRTTSYTPTQTIGGMKLYRFKMWDNNVLVRDFVPCYRKSDNKIGLIDRVNNVFYTTPSGNFTKGDDVANTDIPFTVL